MKRFLTLCFLSVALVTSAQITSTFDTDADGWTFFNGATGATTPGTFNAAGGNPGGYISLAYSSNTSFEQSWIAPGKFRGNQVARSLGMNLQFALQQSAAGTSSFNNGEVRIEGGGTSIVFSLTPKPAVSPLWNAYSLRLDETQGWRVGSLTGPLATRTEIIQVLSNITALEIRGTYITNATYTSGLDHVILEQRAITDRPVITSFTPTQGTAGSTVTISGNNFDPIPANNSVFFGNAAANITSATATSLTVVVPGHAAFGRITLINKTTGKSFRSLTNFTPVFSGGGRIIPASFKPRFTIDHAGGMGGLELADMDYDGWVDLVVANQDNSGIRIYRNLGNGGTLSAASFAAPLLFPTSLSGTNGAGLAVRDLDNDGKLDMVTSGWTGGPGAFATFRNTSTPGNLTFEPVERWNGASDESPVTSAEDIDGDGQIDLVSGEGSSPGSTWVIQNISTPGNVEFAFRQVLFSGGGISHQGATLADLDGDGKPEFIHKIQNAFTQQNIHVNTSTPGTISFAPALTLSVGIQGGMLVYDFNKDGKNDLAWKDGFSNDDVYVRLNSNSGGPLSISDFSTQIILDSETGYYGGLGMADINGDGEPDLLVTDSDKVAVFENNFSAGTFDANDFVKGHLFSGAGATSYPTTTRAADLNGDGKPEMVFGTTNTTPDRIVIYENQNIAAPQISITTVSPLQAPIGSTVTITGNNFSPIANDNHVYFGGVKASVLTASTTVLTVSVPPGAGHDVVSVRVGELTSSYHLPFHTTFSPGVTFDNTHFAPPDEFALTNADYDIEVADLDTDNKPDVAAQVAISNRTVFFINSHLSGSITTGSLTAAGSTANTATNPKLLDVDGNGFIDLVSTSTMYQNNSSPGLITFGPQLSLGIGAANITYSDFNRDGKIDLTGANGGSAQLLLMENRSTTGALVVPGTFGSFSTEFTIAKPAAGGGIASADFDADGLPDVVVTNPGSDNLSIFPNANATRVNSATFGVRIDIPTGDNPGRVYTGDFDDDNRLDLLIYHGTGTNPTLLSVFQNQSTPGNFSFNRIDLTNPSAATVATIADLDGDGKPEIITTSETGNRFSIFKNIHPGGALSASSFAAPFNTTVTAPRGLTTGDLNLDGKPEIILTRAAGFLLVYQNLIANPTITSFLPASGPVGTQVVITGTNFSPTTTDNSIQFNGITAYVVSSTSTTITTIVPPGATTGPISVTVNNNTATSASNFTVTPFICPPVARQGGDLDVSFDPFVQSPVSFTAVELQSTGQSIVAAPLVTINGSNYQGLLRFNTNGSLDNSFTTPLDYFPDYRQLIVMPNDQILVVEFGTDSYIRRLNANGSLDNTFNSPGYYASTIFSIGYQSDNKVLFSIYDDPAAGVFLYRLNADGTFDNSFTPIPDFTANVIVQQTDGKILAAGPSGIIRVEDSGSLDPTFTAISALDGDVTDMVIQSNGKIVLVGTFTGINGFPARNIARLNSDGSIDTGFLAGNGFSLYAGAQPNSLKLLASDNLLVAGEFTSYNDEVRTRVLVLNADGSLQCSFDPQAGPNASVVDAAVQADGKILIVGGLTNYDGTPRNAFARVNGIATSCVPASERAALVALYNATNGSSWTNKTNWLSADENTWFGVTVTGCRVTNLFLTTNNLTGSIPTEIGDLPALQTLQLENNLLAGSIPTSIGNLTNLTSLDLRGNQLSGAIPNTIGNLTSLQSLVLDQNQLTGAIPNSIYTITALRNLELGANQLTGTISTSISNLTNLTALGLSGNQLSGNLPSELGNLTNLNRLQLAVNQFSGNLPPSIGNLVNLTEFSVFKNQLSGTVPFSLGNLVNLTALGLSVNQFTGDVPVGIGLIPTLNDVSLRDNDFTSIPPFVSNAFTDLLVYGNKLHFGHLEPNMGKTGFVYAPQDNLPGGSAAACEGTPLTISFATPGTANLYQWFKDGLPIPGATSASFTKPGTTLADAGNYTVQITNTLVPGLTLTSDNFVVTVSTLPTAPVATGVNVCPNTVATLTATGGSNGQYRWYTTAVGGTALPGEFGSQLITPPITTSTSYYVSINNGTCESTRTMIAVTVTNSACPPPVIESTPLTTTVGGIITLDLVSLITTAGNNLDVASIQLVGSLPSGAMASITNGVLTVNYNGIAFSGAEDFTVRACDLLGNCSTQNFTIEVVGEIVVYNAVSANRDGKNELFRIEFIDLIPDARQNRVTILNRWGDVVWEGENYNNGTIAFTGMSKTGNDLPAGTYFYKIEFSSGLPARTGFLSLKR